MIDDFLDLIEKLIGTKSTDRSKTKDILSDSNLFKDGNFKIGYSQFNEILFLLNYDRISDAFFQFMVDNTFKYQLGSALTSLDKMKDQINIYIKWAMLERGNIQYAFENISKMSSMELQEEFDSLIPIDESVYSNRNDELISINKINAEDTFYLGYMVQNEIRTKLEQNSNDKEAQIQKQKMNEIIDLGIKNQLAT